MYFIPYCTRASGHKNLINIFKAGFKLKTKKKKYKYNLLLQVLNKMAYKTKKREKGKLVSAV